MGILRERFQVRFWGVRGSYPTSSSETLGFGGHTSCVEIQVGDRRLIFDAGTGIIPLGKDLIRSGRPLLNLNLFFSHTHHDHLMGFYFFEPLLKASTRVFVFGPNADGTSLATTLRTAMSSRLFPIGLQELRAEKEIFSLKGGEIIQLASGKRKPKVKKKSPLPPVVGAGGIVILTHKSHAHPKYGSLLYRVEYRGKSVVYATDIEQKKGGYADVIEFASGADLLIHDAQYRHSEYVSKTDSKKGWGHSTIERAAEVAKKAGVKQLALFHHDPTHDDKTIRLIARQAKRLFSGAVAAYEGMTVDLL